MHISSLVYNLCANVSTFQTFEMVSWQRLRQTIWSEFVFFFLSLGLVKTMGLKLSSSVFYQAICHCYWRLWTNFFVSFWSIKAALFLLSLSVNCQIMANNATFNVSKKLIWLFNIYWVVANITIYYKYQIGMFGFCCGPFDVQHPL